VGDVVVFERGPKGGWQGHVGIVTAINTDGSLEVLGGNQSDSLSGERGVSVNVKTFKTDTVLGYRRITQNTVGLVPPMNIPGVGTKLDVTDPATSNRVSLAITGTITPRVASTKATDPYIPIPASVEQKALARGGAVVAPIPASVEQKALARANAVALADKNAAIDNREFVKDPLKGTATPKATPYIPIPASVEQRMKARGGAVANEMDLAAMAALEAKNAAVAPRGVVTDPLKAVPRVRLQDITGLSPAPAAGFKPQTATEAFPGNPAAAMFDETWNTDGTRKVPLVDVAVPAVVRQASIAGKSPLANGASLKVPARGTGSMGIPAASAAIPRTTVRSTYIAPRRQPVYGVSATGARTDYGASPGQSTAGLKPGDRIYNADTNSWELK
jgi:hypothetical protein